MSKLSFLRPSNDEPSLVREDTLACEDVKSDEKSFNSPSSTSVDIKKTRKRKGSLRKTALLGTGKLRQERRGSNIESYRPIFGTPWRHHSENEPNRDVIEISPTSPTSDWNQNTFEYDPSEQARAIDIPRANGNPRVPTRNTEGTALPANSLVSPVIDLSTTDEEDALSFPQHPSTQAPKKPSATSADYFPPQSNIPGRRRSNIKTQKSPLSINAPVTPPDEWDYSETEWWGWVVLIVTWIVFVVGMGSCFEIWSWAWDVGETPYAPPELEDDPTLPIVGYYPALIILTAVMAWVWVVIAWVGMKYFKHAKISGEDG